MTAEDESTDVELLTPNEFRERVLARDNRRCVVCGAEGKDAHHIMDRRLFDNGGYYLDNGTTLCEEHRTQAEQTILTCEEIRAAAGITTVVLPDHLYLDERWDKLGNMILKDGRRIRGELFNDESVQMALGCVLPQFLKWAKYPRTYHLPNSPGRTDDDRVLQDTSCFRRKRIIISEKRDGENTTLYTDYVHSRSVDSPSHPTMDWIKNYQSQIGWNIPPGWRVCGENLWAKHSIAYDDLASYFEAFSIWDDTNTCLGWDASSEWFGLIGVAHVPVLYDGSWDDSLMERFIPQDTDQQEGFVVRLAERFHYSQFRVSVAKWVREGHIQTSHNWKRQRIEKNRLKETV
jgi:hypothetical protein